MKSHLEIAVGNIGKFMFSVIISYGQIRKLELAGRHNVKKVV